jgi:hypothetical protein
VKALRAAVECQHDILVGSISAFDVLQEFVPNTFHVPDRQTTWFVISCRTPSTGSTVLRLSSTTVTARPFRVVRSERGLSVIE